MCDSLAEPLSVCAQFAIDQEPLAYSSLLKGVQGAINTRASSFSESNSADRNDTNCVPSGDFNSLSSVGDPLALIPISSCRLAPASPL